MTQEYENFSTWSLAVFAARETPEVLAASVRAAVVACTGRRTTIDVLINGNPSLARDFAELTKTIAIEGGRLRVWEIVAPDKAHTWNEYIYRIWEGGNLTFFIDGYVRPRPDALQAIEQHLATTPNAMAASGVPTSGRSAKAMREAMLRTGGGIHGNLYALTETSMKGVRETGFRLPLGIYRNDGLLGAVLTYRLDPSKNKWTRGSVVSVPGASWDVDGISELSYKNLLGHFKRRLRQAQGALESQAFRDHMAVKRLPPRLLPVSAQEMVNNWLASEPKLARSMFLKNPLCLYAAYQLREPRDWTTTQTAPVLLRELGTEEAIRTA